MEKRHQIFFAYIRVSTQKQGVEGSSLEAQQRAIRDYAARSGLAITQWFEERETAAKRGRPVFQKMLGLLRKGRARGVVIHKIDRSARNLKDWADLGDLIDLGVDVRFTTENYDLRSRGGRLSADIQAVVAADYVRNLREEVRKGMYERVRQGRFPWRAPVGYLNKGKGIKTLDLEQAQLVRETFELYATGSWSLERLIVEMHKRGLRNTRKSRLSLSGISKMLNNPFYCGLMRLQKSGEVMPGTHEPIISKALFDRVHELLNGKGKLVDHIFRHTFTFSRLIRCRGCKYHLIAERQKGNVYYRCHTTKCPQRKSLREEVIERELLERLGRIRFQEAENQLFRERFQEFCAGALSSREDHRKKLELRLGEIRAQVRRLVDGYADGVFAKDVILEKQNALISEERELRDQLERPDVRQSAEIEGRMQKFLELANSASDCFKQALPQEKRRLVRILTSNLEAEHENVFIQLRFPFSELELLSEDNCGGHSLDKARTWNGFFQRLYEACVGDPLPAQELCWKAASE